MSVETKLMLNEQVSGRSQAILLNKLYSQSDKSLGYHLDNPRDVKFQQNRVDGCFYQAQAFECLNGPPTSCCVLF